MKNKTILTVLLLSSCVVFAAPQIGFVYPAGAQQGTSVDVLIGGQGFLRGNCDIVISGEGLTAQIQGVGRLRDNNLRGKFRTFFNAIKKGLKGEELEKVRASLTEDGTKIPDDWYFDNIENMTDQELEHIEYSIIRLNRQQRTPQIDDRLIVRLTVSPDTKPGRREIRIKNNSGLSNPLIFEVGMNPELMEYEPNNTKPRENDVLVPPAVLNGQILPGDVDRYLFEARKGQKLVIETKAQQLMPYMADAVPGWFQATIAVFNDKNKEVAYSDDFRFNPDPVMLFDVPQTGKYTLEIKDSIYRGREDFVYRVTIAESPFVTGIFPLGLEKNQELMAAVTGWNLPVKAVPLKSDDSGCCVQTTSIVTENAISNPIEYAVSEIPEVREKEAPSELKNAMAIEMPVIVNGKIARPGDTDLFSFEAEAGQKLVLEVESRRLKSPLDSIVSLKNANGELVEWNDDSEKTQTGLLTHFADSYLITKIEEAGKYYVEIADSCGHGGPDFAYRLRISEPMPSFDVFTSVSGLRVDLGRYTPIQFSAIRKDGFDGEIKIALKEGSAFGLSGASIPAGCNEITAMLQAPSEPGDSDLYKLEFVATADSCRVKKVCPADDMTQAFVLHHLVPAMEFLVNVNGNKKRSPLVWYDDSLPAKLVEGRGGSFFIKTVGGIRNKNVKLAITKKDGPELIEVGKVVQFEDGYKVNLRAKQGLGAGFKGNLILDARVDYLPDGKGEKKKPWSIGYLPAIPFEIVSSPTE